MSRKIIIAVIALVVIVCGAFGVKALLDGGGRKAVKIVPAGAAYTSVHVDGWEKPVKNEKTDAFFELLKKSEYKKSDMLSGSDTLKDEYVHVNCTGGGSGMLAFRIAKNDGALYFFEDNDKIYRISNGAELGKALEAVQ